MCSIECYDENSSINLLAKFAETDKKRLFWLSNGKFETKTEKDRVYL